MTTLGTFIQESPYPGKELSMQENQLIVEDSGPVAVDRIRELDTVGQIQWVSEDMRRLAYSVESAAGPGDPAAGPGAPTGAAVLVVVIVPSDDPRDRRDPRRAGHRVLRVLGHYRRRHAGADARYRISTGARAGSAGA